MFIPGPIEHIAVKTCIRIASASNGGLEGTTVALHWERPVGPDRSDHLNAVSDVQQRMDGQRTHGEPLRILLIVDSDKYQY